MKSREIRQKFFDFFTQHGHTQVASSSLIPAQDPTLLFTNAGMNQFKDAFLGLEKRSYSRAVTIQKCMRAGGKHNDLDQVGFTKRHLTFFEMMGNFSFGDYFKKEAIEFAWNFLTKTVNLPPEKLFITVFREDDEAHDLWHKHIGVPQKQLSRLDEKDNFWQMGDTGPCGPCSEIYVDRGTTFGCGSKKCAPGCDCDRFLEVWNLVFMQFNRQPNGALVPLQQTGVDTGMGLERLCAILQGKDSVFEIDLFQEIIVQIEQLTKRKYKKQSASQQAAFHVLADHVRAASFLLADSCTPSNEGRGYVLRKIIRRAALFEQKLTDHSIFPQLAKSLIHSMQDSYPELATSEEYIISVLTSEIEKFSQNLARGKNILQQHFEKNKTNKTISGEQAFKLYDTYGFPVELTQLIAQEEGFTVDRAGFEEAMEQQRLQSGKKVSYTDENTLNSIPATLFTGYEKTEDQATVVALLKDDQPVQRLSVGETGWLITDRSPFFVECGGQVSDEGWLVFDDKQVPIEGLKKIHDAIAVQVTLPALVTPGTQVRCVVDKQKRLATMKNHTATHLLQAALIELLGKQIRQSGSVVNPDYLRFDFTYHQNVTPEQIQWLENRVNEKVWENIPVSVSESTYKEATKKGVIAIFGEKYNPESVRVIDVPGFSAELCGGTHVQRTGDIGCFKITEVSALSAGNRRIVALTGPKALEQFQSSFAAVKQLSQFFKVQLDEVITTVEKQQEQLKACKGEIKQLKKTAWQQALPTWLTQAQELNGHKALCLVLADYEVQELRDIAQQLQQKQPGIYLLMSNVADKSYFVGVAALSLHDKLQTIAEWLANDYSLRGGGKKGAIQGGGAAIGDPTLPSKFYELVK